MLLRDILLCYVDVDAQRNPIKNTAVEKRDTENQHNKNFIIKFSSILINSHSNFYTLYVFIFQIHLSKSTKKSEFSPILEKLSL